MFRKDSIGRYIKMSLEQRRKLYKCGEKYLQLNNIPTWVDYKPVKVSSASKQAPLFKASTELNRKISVWQGDITRLEIDAIVNAANQTLLGGGGVDGCIHNAAGPALKTECAILHGCETGNAKITAGHNLPAKHVIHTVGPMGKNADKLKSCYKTCLNLLKKHDLRQVAFPCISTGIYGYPNRDAAVVALNTVRQWLETKNNAQQVDRIIFCLFLPVDLKIYEELLPVYFPVETREGTSTATGAENTVND